MMHITSTLADINAEAKLVCISVGGSGAGIIALAAHIFSSFIAEEARHNLEDGMINYDTPALQYAHFDCNKCVITFAGAVAGGVGGCFIGVTTYAFYKIVEGFDDF